MKKYICLIVCMVALVTYANNFSASTKQAQQFFKKRPVTLVYNDPQESYYIFNRKANKGFVIIRSADRSILGYSLTGTITPDSIPANMLFYLQLCASVPQRTTSLTYPVVEPLLGDIAYGQTRPFNSLCPTDCQTGCVATALTQVMRYYKYPSRGQGIGSATYNGTTLTYDLNTSLYDYVNMLPIYDTSANATQVSAVATLMRDAGYACKMRYNTSASAAGDYMICKALIDNFQYDKGITWHVMASDRFTRGYTFNTTDGIMHSLVAELQAHRPVIITGTQKESYASMGHAFICDGIQSDGTVHINWGYGGAHNGYFVVPDFGFSGGGFKYNLAFVMGIYPAIAGATTEDGQSICIDGTFTPLTQGYRKTSTETFNLNAVNYINNFGRDTWFIHFGAILRDNTDTLYIPLELDQSVYEDIGVESMYEPFTETTLTIQTTPSTLTQGLHIGCYNYTLGARRTTNGKNVGTLYDPVYVKDQGATEIPCVLTQDSLLFYPVGSNYLYTNAPTDLQYTYSGGIAELSWSGEGPFRVCLWDNTTLTTYSTTTNHLSVTCTENTHWAVFQSEERNDVVKSNSPVVYGSPIIDSTPTGNEDITSFEGTISVQGGSIYVTLPTPERVDIYDNTGRIVHHCEQCTTTTFTSSTTGVYIVRVGNYLKKVLTYL